MNKQSDIGEIVVDALPWRQRIGSQRDWMWRGWQTRYTYLRSQKSESDPPLMLIHGFGASIGHWRHNVSVLSQHHTVYALDLLGFGASEKAIAPYNVVLWIEQVHDFWLTFVREPVVLIGNSIGSMVCLAAAKAYPEMVKGVVMLNLPDSSVLDTPEWAGTAVKVFRPIAAVGKSVFTFPLIFNPFFRVLRSSSLIRLWARQAYTNSDSISDELVEILSIPARDRGAVKALRSMVTTPKITEYRARSILPTIKIPMLLFWGKQDKFVPPSLAESCVKLNPKLELVEVENAGHCPHDEQPEIVNRKILSWIEECVR
ncbi:alpha/beta fold hydrolase [Leptolyngbya sp. AN03gr2]|uniref:alpha/beta fold hydrolase n=1 Tax=unclassified Leptolyngbya TaxID=2650499 RepID=UPI003D3111B9